MVLLLVVISIVNKFFHHIPYLFLIETFPVFMVAHHVFTEWTSINLRLLRLILTVIHSFNHGIRILHHALLIIGHILLTGRLLFNSPQHLLRVENEVVSFLREHHEIGIITLLLSEMTPLYMTALSRASLRGPRTFPVLLQLFHILSISSIETQCLTRIIKHLQLMLIYSESRSVLAISQVIK